MANQGHVRILGQGVAAWNTWREQYRERLPDLRGADLSNKDLNHANLDDANLNHADLSGANLRSANLVDAKLSGADLSGADLSIASLIGTDLSGAKLIGANLSIANLIGANLDHADLIGASLIGADLIGVNLSDAMFRNTILGNVDLRTVKGLSTVDHRGPSTIGTDTLERSHGDIPEIFLRGAGLSDTFIGYARALVHKPLDDYYTCFISYSSKDELFAQRLYNDLQDKGVRCWFAPEDMKIGAEIREDIHKSIRMYDKLLIVLSLNSLRSTWVKDEVEAAFEKEKQQPDKLVLFPIKLDETVMQTNQAWAATLRQRRHIGNFTLWTDHACYQTSFVRLLRDLRA